NVAKDSLSQIVPQSLHDTRSPNHWWASSCEFRLAMRRKPLRPSVRLFSPSVVAETFSIPPPKSYIASCAYLGQGYLTPVICEKNESISGVSPKEASII